MFYSYGCIRDFEKKLYRFKGIEKSLGDLHDKIMEIRNGVELSGVSTNSFNGGGMDSNSRERSLVWFLDKEKDIADEIKKKEREYILLKMAFDSLSEIEKRIVDLFYFQRKSIKEISVILNYCERSINRKKKMAVLKMMEFWYSK